MIARILLASALAAVAIGSAARQTPTHSVAIVVPPSPRDTGDHLDVLVSDVDTLRVLVQDSSGAPIAQNAQWSSGNPTVVAVGSKTGVVRALKRGYGTISASVDGVTARTRVCVSDVPRDTVQTEIVSLTVGPMLSAVVSLRPSNTEQLLAHFALKATPNWGPCVHWFVADSDRAFAWIDRRGVLHTPKTARFGAAIGPDVP